ncbi:hypothetical protein LCGC14_2688300 [marine sediment metagenome]|uniref:Uncharacterized protein n=1 Tax=marine sediment metagenome TaxID=412755 RepID=A0A0F9A6U2_9ZZZZ
MTKNKIPLTDIEKESTQRDILIAKFQIEGLELNVDATQKQIDSQITLKKQRIELMNAKNQLEQTKKNLKVLERQLRDGHFIDKNTGDFVYREDSQEGVKK